MRLKKFLIFTFVIINFVGINQSYSIEPDVFVYSTKTKGDLSPSRDERRDFANVRTGYQGSRDLQVALAIYVATPRGGLAVYAAHIGSSCITNSLLA